MWSKSILIWTLALAQGSYAAPADLPTVDLTYQTHRAKTFDSTRQQYTFGNIPYAQPPVGPLRFRAPVPPQFVKQGIQDGGDGKICPQAASDWSTALAPVPIAFDDPRISEDCLVLDVIVSKSTFDNRNAANNQGAPVLIWIHGGGTVLGSKNLFGNPNGLIARSKDDGSSGIVYVAINYRLGAFGFLAGPTLQQNGDSNAGLYDQRLAIEWVRDNIAKFGGNPQQITVIGESGGGGSIVHQITAFGGSKPVAFQRAIAQSPGYLPIVSTSQQESAFQRFLSICGVSTIDEARNLPSKTLIDGNQASIKDAAIGTLPYGPTVDGVFAPKDPSKLLIEGSYAQDVTMMSAHNLNEGVLFANPLTILEKQVKENFVTLFPSLTQQQVSKALNELYPPIYDGSQGYIAPAARIHTYYADAVFNCHANSMLRASKALGKKSYGYRFAVQPSLHGSDVPYTFYNNGDLGANPVIAAQMQRYFTNFAKTGDPNKGSVPTIKFPEYGNGNILNIDLVSLVIPDPNNQTPRCEFWLGAFNVDST